MSLGDGPNQDFLDLAAGAETRRVRDVDGTLRVEIDLGLRFPIHVVCYGSAGAADRPRLSFSDDGQAWWEPQTQAFQTGVVIVPVPGSWTRYVRITRAVADEGEATAVEVWCEASAFDLMTLRASLGLTFELVNETAGASVYHAYSLIRAADVRSRSLAGIAMLENGQFGNGLIQYHAAISVARSLNLRYVKVSKLDRSRVIFLTERLVCDDITFLPPDEPLPDEGYFLSGMFFDITRFRMPAGEAPMDMRRTVHTYIRKLFNALPETFPEKAGDELLIHIRSGDIFSTCVDPNYPQPPLAFYRMVIDRLRREGRIAAIKLVFENRLNPVIAAVEAYARGLGLPVETQSESLVADVAALVNGRYLVFGLGTFGPAICHLSERVEQVFYFASGSPQGFQSIQTIDKVVEVRDVAARYIKVGEWQNTDAQRRMMVEYPAEALAFDDAA